MNGRRTSLVGGGAERTIRDLCERGLATRALCQELRSPLRRLLAFDAYCVSACDPETGVVLSSVGDGLSPEHAQALFAIEAQGDDFNSLNELRAGEPGVRSLSQTTGGRLELSQRMREIFLPLGFKDEMRAALRVAGSCFGFLHLFRREAPFSAPDLARVSVVSPVIARGLQRAASRALQLAPAMAGEKPALPALLVLDAKARVVQESSGAAGVLAANDAIDTDSGLPHLVYDIASRTRRGASARAGLITAKQQRLSVIGLDLGEHTAIVIDALGAADALSMTLSSSELTPREREVCRLLADGHSNQSIASELGIALYTVKDHVKSLLTKTRSATRAELSARVRGG